MSKKERETFHTPATETHVGNNLPKPTGNATTDGMPGPNLPKRTVGPNSVPEVTYCNYSGVEKESK